MRCKMSSLPIETLFISSFTRKKSTCHYKQVLFVFFSPECDMNVMDLVVLTVDINR